MVGMAVMDIVFLSTPLFSPFPLLCRRNSRNHVNEIICSKITHTELITNNGSNRSGSEPGSLEKALVPRGGEAAPCRVGVSWAKVLEAEALAFPSLLTQGLCKSYSRTCVQSPEGTVLCTALLSSQEDIGSRRCQQGV